MITLSFDLQAGNLVQEVWTLQITDPGPRALVRKTMVTSLVPVALNSD